jgi:hypothetical protein
MIHHSDRHLRLYGLVKIVGERLGRVREREEEGRLRKEQNDHK